MTRSGIQTDEQIAHQARDLMNDLLRFVNEVMRPRNLGLQFAWGKNPDGSDNLARFDVFRYIDTSSPPGPKAN